MKRFFLVLAVFIFSMSMPVQVQAEEKITISFAGDCTLGGFKGQGSGNQFKDYYDKDNPSYYFKNVQNVFSNDDITFVNLEGALTYHPQTAVKKFPIKGEPKYVDVLLSGSIEAVGLSNNHTYDCGQTGYDECKDILDAAGIANCGGLETTVIEKKGIKTGLASVSCWADSEAERKTVKEAIDSLKMNGCDIVCVMFHGGIEREYESNKVTENFAHFVIDSGADIVVGAHPHVLQGIEVYNGKIICYSLGNFCFGANKNPSDKDCFILQQDFIVNNGSAVYGGTKVIPCKISSTDEKNDYCPTIQNGEEAERILDKIKKHSSKYENTIF